MNIKARQWDVEWKQGYSHHRDDLAFAGCEFVHIGNSLVTSVVFLLCIYMTHEVQGACNLNRV